MQTIVKSVIHKRQSAVDWGECRESSGTEGKASCGLGEKRGDSPGRVQHRDMKMEVCEQTGDEESYLLK